MQCFRLRCRALFLDAAFLQEELGTLGELTLSMRCQALFRDAALLQREPGTLGELTL